MAYPQYEREKGERFASKGLRTGAAPDSLEPGQYLILQNMRGFSATELRTRPGEQLLFSTVGASRNISSYTKGTNPRYVAISASDAYLDTGAVIDTGYDGTTPPSMIPFRPNQSSAPWIYAGDDSQYHKLSAPGAADAVIAQKVGIAEPQAPVDFGIGESLFTPLSAGPGISYSHQGTAGAITDTPKLTDSIVAVYQDPAIPPGTLPEYTIQTAAANPSYQTGEFLGIGISPNFLYYQVKDVYPPLTGSVTIQGIYYYAGTTGRCVIVPFNVGKTDNDGLTIMQQNLLAGIRRGALITLGNLETCYVLGTAVAPDGTISFEVVTNLTHVVGETVTGQPAIKILMSSQPTGGTPVPPTPGLTIFDHYASFNVNTGIGSIQTHLSTSNPHPFSYQNVAYRPDDFIHISVMCNDLSLLNECRILFDISDGTFSKDYYYYAFRPSDIQNAIAQNAASGGLTQLGGAQLSAQRIQIDLEAQARGQNPSSATFTPGSGQWCDLYVPISQFQRIGSNQNLSLLNINSYQVLVDANADLVFGFHTVDICGGFSPNIGQVGTDYKYRIRGRSSLTGARSNPSPTPRYGIRPRREGVLVILPNTAPDPQIDTWDIFRIGGSIDTYRKIGSILVGQGNFIDNYADVDVSGNEVLPFDDLEPWPSIRDPFTFSGASGVGTVITVTSTGIAADLQRMLPGNLVRIGQQTYTLWTRPTLDGFSSAILQLNENAGVLSGVEVNIYEPLLANQNLPFIWGPDAFGTVFAVGDKNRPGTVSFAKRFNPDSAPDPFNVEVTPPSEPLTGGALLNGLSGTCTLTKWWALRPSFGGVQQYTQQLVPVGAGAVSHFAICNDTRAIYFVGEDGVYETNLGTGKALTTRANIYSLFPHGAVPGQPHVYAGVTIYPPDYTRVGTFRLSVANGFLYFDYQSTLGGSPLTHLVYDIAGDAWYGPDAYIDDLSFRYAIPQQAGNDLVLAGGPNGNIYVETDLMADSDGPINCVTAIRELCPDGRAFSLFGDIGLDILPTNATALTASAYSLGAPIGFSATFQSPTRLPLAVLDIGGDQTLKSLGVVLSWSQTYGSGETQPVTLYVFDISVIPKPETIQGRFTDWSEAQGNQFFQGFIMEADTASATKGLQVRDADTLALHPFTQPAVFNGQSVKAFSFNTPFIAHSVRIEPTDENPWRLFNLKWISVPYPEAVDTYRSEGTSNGMRGFQFAYMGQLAYISTQSITLTFRFDQLPDITLAFPAGGNGLDPIKVQFKIPPNKQKIISYEASSSAPFYLFREDCEIWTREWGSASECQIVRPWGGPTTAPIALV